MDSYIIVITIIGLAALSMAWVPAMIEKSFLSYPIIYLLIGVLIYSLPLSLPFPDPLWHEGYAVHLTELSVIVSLMATGLKIRRRVSWKNWKIPLKLVSVTMLLSIGILAFLGWWWLGLAPAAAVLLGAVMAPTDPVLAEQVQVGPPHDTEEDDVRFSLTAEAGLNDGSAFPFVWLAIAIAVGASTGEGWVTEWVLWDLVYKVIAGVAMGYVIGRGLAYLIFYLPRSSSFPETGDGFVALSATLVTYGLTEMVHGYGFIAVFIAALTMSSYEEGHEYHTEMHDFVTQIERILMVILLMLFGGSLVTGLLDHLTWEGVLLGLGFLFIIRPLTAYISIFKDNCSIREKVAISFFGIRGIGSFFYLAFAFNEANFTDTDELWSIVGFIVMVSIVLHGVTASRVMDYLDSSRRRERRAKRRLASENKGRSYRDEQV
ncbi:cation:proton antiporter [Pontibacter pudoricolor]|uniref:cation:proton antiporter n=1 Tax=Pontibacter pudoricolor TaxID=2694930 RepID=UPI0013909A14|nr:sodium:proton antiporter [Pontibacter pudoricolor]